MGELAWHSAAKHAAAIEEFESAAVARERALWRLRGPPIKRLKGSKKPGRKSKKPARTTVLPASMRT